MRPGATLDALNFSLAGAREGFGPFIAVYLQARGFDPAVTGIVMSLAGASGLVSTTPIGAVIDHSPSKRFGLVIAVFAIAVGSVAIVATSNVYIIGAAQLLIGVGDTGIFPLVAAITLGLVGHEAFGARAARNEAFNNAGNAANAAFAAVLGYCFGLQYVAVMIVVMAIATAFTVARIDTAAIDHVVARGGPCDDRPIWQALTDVPPLFLLAVTVLIFQSASSAMLPFLAQARTEAGADPSLTTGAMCVITRIPMIFAALAAPWIAKRRGGYADVMTLVLALVVVRAVLAFYADSWWLVAPVQILEGISVGMACVAIPALNAEIMAGTGRANIGLGAVMTAFGAGAMLSPLIAGFVAQRVGFSGSFIAYAIVAFIGLIVWTIGRRVLGADPSMMPMQGAE